MSHAYIDIVPLERATGPAQGNSTKPPAPGRGRVWGIVSAMSLNPRAMKTSMEFYKALMYGPSPLGRGQREMLAVVVSAANHCVY